MSKKRSLLDEYRFPGFRPKATTKGIFGDSKAKVITMERRQKKRFAVVAAQIAAVNTIQNKDWSGIYHVVGPEYIWRWRCGEWIVQGATK